MQSYCYPVSTETERMLLKGDALSHFFPTPISFCLFQLRLSASLILCTFPLLPPTKLPSSLNPRGSCSPFAHLKLPLKWRLVYPPVFCQPTETILRSFRSPLSQVPHSRSPSSLCLFNSKQRLLSHDHLSEQNKPSRTHVPLFPVTSQLHVRQLPVASGTEER